MWDGIVTQPKLVPRVRRRALCPMCVRGFDSNGGQEAIVRDEEGKEGRPGLAMHKYSSC